MAQNAAASIAAPFMAFNFAVEISVPNVASRVCGAAFVECDGLELSMEVKTIREGGNNARQIRLPGPAALGTLTLRRGMTDAFDLWKWFDAVHKDPGVRADARVILYAEDHNSVRARFELSRCMPIKLKAPALNAKDGMIAIEEFQLVYESIELVTDPSGGP